MLARVYAVAIRTGAADPDRSQVPPTIQTGELLRHLFGDAAATYPPQHAGILLNASASLRGYLMAEIFGSLTDLVGDTDQLFDAHLRTVMLGMGFDPTHIDTVTRRAHGS